MNRVQTAGPVEGMAAEAGGARTSGKALLPQLYSELRKLAALYLRRERPGHTLQPTALVHEAFIRLTDGKELHCESRAHFRAIAAKAMREVLVRHARDRRRLKRGGGRRQVPLEDVTVAFEDRAFDLMALHEALEGLATRDPQKANVVEIRFFGGLSIEETAKALGISHATVERDWKFARAWLRRELGGSGRDGAH